MNRFAEAEAQSRRGGSAQPDDADLDRQYRCIGIPAVAAAMRYRNEAFGKAPARAEPRETGHKDAAA